MSYKIRVNEKRNDFTDTEEKISIYIEQNIDKVVSMSVKDISNEIGVSPASIVRFSKILGYSGYSGLKIDIAKGSNNDLKDSCIIIKENDRHMDIAKKLELLNRNTIVKTLDMLNDEVIEKAINSVEKAKRIYIYGVGASGLVALDLYYKFSRINKFCTYNSDSHMNMINSAHMNNHDVLIAISYSGETKEILTPVRVAKENGAKVLSIVSSGKSALSKISDYVINIPKEEKLLRIGAISSRNSALMITDLIYLSVASKNMDKTMKHVIETRNIIEKIK